MRGALRRPGYLSENATYGQFACCLNFPGFRTTHETGPDFSNSKHSEATPHWTGSFTVLLV